VSALERELRTALLVRGRAGTVPTPAGELLLVHADAMAARLDLADTQMDALLAAERRALRLGAFPSALATIVPAAVRALRERDAELEVAIHEGTVDELVDAVQAGRLDAAVCFQAAAAPRRAHDGLRRIDLVEEPMVAILAATHRLAGRKQIALRDLADEAWMAPSTDGLLVDACRAAGFEPRIVIHTRDPLAARAIAAAGLAVSLTPASSRASPCPASPPPPCAATPPAARSTAPEGRSKPSHASSAATHRAWLTGYGNTN
jgi:DNA-binding transcriptional LysR family regulator